MGINEVKTAPQSPWQNPYVERLIGSIRRDCINAMIILNEAHLKRILNGRKEWPENTVRLTSLLSGPVEDLAGYIPDFGFELYDLHRFSDDEIKEPIMNRVVLLLFKHIFDPDLRHRLPGIFSLLRTLMEKETGLQWLEVVFRYLTSALEE